MLLEVRDVNCGSAPTSRAAASGVIARYHAALGYGPRRQLLLLRTRRAPACGAEHLVRATARVRARVRARSTVGLRLGLGSCLCTLGLLELALQLGLGPSLELATARLHAAPAARHPPPARCARQLQPAALYRLCRVCVGYTIGLERELRNEARVVVINSTQALPRTLVHDDV